MPVATIEWVGQENGYTRFIDQTRLPNEVKKVQCKKVEDMFTAIKTLQVRGAPAIGIAGAFGVLLGMQSVSDHASFNQFQQEIHKTCQYLGLSRPTAVNLFWALNRMENIVTKNKDKSVPELKSLLLQEALAIWEEDKSICRRIGENGAQFIVDGCGILTHCNAGGLATADYGTALAVMFKAKEQGKRIRVYADETRPLLQGARLTTWELMQEGIDVTLICDNMAAQVMKEGKVNMVIVGADRIAANGDTANKIGTYGVAILAKEHHIPFYVAAPLSTFDLELPSGTTIPIEQRGTSEITNIRGTEIAPQNVKTYCPAFDVTPARYIEAIITEKGVIRRPSSRKIQKHFKK